MTCERPAAGNVDSSTPVNGTGPLIKGGSGQATGPEGSRARIHTRAATLNAELREASGGLTRSVEPGLLVNGDVAVSH